MSPDKPRLSIAHGLLLGTVAMLPFGVGPELPMLALSIAGIVQLLRGAIDWRLPGTRLALVLGLAYWLPQFISAFDSVATQKSWTEVVLDLRFLPVLLFVAQPVNDAPGANRMLLSGIAALGLAWCADALLQATTGYSLGGAATGDRLSGIFGADNLKLGGVLAVLAPFALIAGWQRFRAWGFIAVFVVVLIVVLLAGARAAWFGLVLGTVLCLWHLLGMRRALPLLAGVIVLCAAVASGGYFASERFAERVDRTAAALNGDRDGLDHALAGRLGIWESAWRMGEDHPLNGVGVRAFRYAYPDYANPDDHFVDSETGQGAFHAHQILLELWSETGGVGLACWLLASIFAWRHWHRLSVPARNTAMPAAVALVVALFPLNTHYAVYSAFWGLLLVWLLGAWLALMNASDADSTRRHSG